MHRGFSLLETIIYIGLFALLMAAAVPAAFYLLQSADKVGDHDTTYEEETFVLRKIDWALASIDPSHAYTPASGSSATLSLTRYDGTQVAFQLVSGKVEMSTDGGATYLPLTTDNVSVGALSFEHIDASGSGPAGISALITVDGRSASTTKYIRQ